MWAALRYTGLHVWGRKGLQDYISRRAEDIREENARRRETDAQKKELKAGEEQKAQRNNANREPHQMV